jgi:hypothetical protein
VAEEDIGEVIRVEEVMRHTDRVDGGHSYFKLFCDVVLTLTDMRSGAGVVDFSRQYMSELC